MSLIKSLMLAFICVFAGTAIAETAKVNITWSNPDDYKDIQKSAGESEQTFRERIASNIQAHMDKLAEGLPEDSTLNMNVTNLTLAGSVRTSGAAGSYQDVRVVEDGYRARMSFSYQLLDASGQAVKQGEENLKSPMSGGSISRTARNEPFEIEKKMLTRWFKNTFK